MLSLLTCKQRKPRSGREAALHVTVKVAEGSYVNLALKSVLAGSDLSRQERNLAAEIGYGVVRRLNTLRWVLEQFLSRPLDNLTPWIRGILLGGSYQILYLDKIPPAAAVNEAVELAKIYGHRGVAGLVNGVLRRLVRERDSLPWPERDTDPILYLSLQQSYPQWMLARWETRWGRQDTEALAAAGNVPPAVTVRVNPLKTSPDALGENLRAEGIETEPGFVPGSLRFVQGGSPSSLAAFRQGHFTVQGEASMLAALLLDPRPGEKILDLCSAPGGKTTHIAEMMQDRGQVIACDLHPRRVELVKNSAARLGLTGIQVKVWDGRQAAVQVAGEADRVLLDAPCSGLGVIRRKPDLKWQRSEEDIPLLADLQRQLLASAATAVKPGGVLVYAVCTFEPEETRQVVSAFLATNKEFEEDSRDGALPRGLITQLAKDGPGFYIFPHRHGLDGFYLCRLVRCPQG